MAKRRFGFLWSCPWRIQRKRFEYWVRYQCGPFYCLVFHRRIAP